MHQKFLFRLLLFLLLPATLLAADISFDSARRDFATDGGGSVAIGDFNGDGQLDLATASFGGNVSILLGNGEAAFQPPTWIKG